MKDKIIATEPYSVDLCNENQIIATKHTLWIYVLVQKMSPKGTKAEWYSRNSGVAKAEMPQVPKVFNRTRRMYDSSCRE